MNFFVVYADTEVFQLHGFGNLVIVVDFQSSCLGSRKSKEAKFLLYHGWATDGANILGLRVAHYQQNFISLFLRQFFRKRTQNCDQYRVLIICRGL